MSGFDSSKPNTIAEEPVDSTSRDLTRRTTTSETREKDTCFPGYFCCPLTSCVMKDPVVAMDGYSYERYAINDWFLENDTSPVRREPVTDKRLVPNRALKDAIISAVGELVLRPYLLKTTS